MAKRILLVDDDDELREGIVAILHSAGHEVDEAADGTRALEALGANRYDLLITDVIMPDRDGLELIRALPTHDRPKVLAISGGSRILPAAYTLNASGALGADATLNKPFRAKELLDQVAALLGQ
jgi:DNA-binding response OmpR family regulator